MNFRKKQGFNLSEIGIGCYALSGAYGYKDPQVFTKILRRAFDLGINFFDTADTYGDKAEEILGAALKPYRDQVYIATKVGIREGVQPRLTKQYVKQACENSLKRLDTDHINLYQIHFDDPTTPVEETVQALESLKTAGKIWKYGVGHLPIEKMKSYATRGDIFSAMFELSAVSRDSRQEIIPFCQKSDLAGIAFSVTGRGILTGKLNSDVTFQAGDIRILDPLFQRERFESALKITQEITKIGKMYGKTPVQVAINWVLAQPMIICALMGASSIAHLEENIGGGGWQLDANTLKELDDLFEQENQLLEVQQSKVIRNLLNQALNPDPMQAFTDLIYIIETAVLLKIVKEAEFLPLFIELFEFRDDLNVKSMSEFQRIHKNLREKILESIH